MNTNTGFLKSDGTPDLALLISTFNRCTPLVQTNWLDNVRFCKWDGQYTDGRKHDKPGDPNGAAKPWDNASDIRPMTVDDTINERKAMLVAAFWKSSSQAGAADSEAAGYAVALIEWLVFTKLTQMFAREVPLAADYQEHLGWCLLAPRWRRELGLKRYTLKLADIQRAAAGAPPRSPFANLAIAIADPTLEDHAVELLQQWYDWYVQSRLPEDLRGRAPQTTPAAARKAVTALRTQQQATVPLPYVCRNELEIAALKPYEEIFIPPELTSENEIVFHAEIVGKADLQGRVLGESYNPAWVTEALKQAKAWNVALPVGNPVGVNGLLNSAPTPVQTTGTNGQDNPDGQVQIIHAVYRAVDSDGIPGVYCTTFHPAITKIPDSSNEAPLFAKHEPVEGAGNDLPYSACQHEFWSRSVTSSRGVTERTHTQQNLIKALEDGVVDRQSITLLPPVNVYESPTGTKYEFGPAKQNYVRLGKEPQFMNLPSGQGLVDSVKVHEMVTLKVDNRFGLLSPNVPAVRQQLLQESAVRNFLLAWSKALKMGLRFYQQHGDDAEFARVTGAPPGWLDSHRAQDDLLDCALELDVRELDSELTMKRLEAFLKIGIPTDVMGAYDRYQLSATIARATLGSANGRRIMLPRPAASQQLHEKALAIVAQMYLGNEPTYLDDKDPTAPALLQETNKIVMQNPVYLSALNDEALVTVAGPNARLIAQQLGQGRQPNDRFSTLLLKWLENLKFVGVAQVQNAQTGRQGVETEQAA